MTKEEYQNQTPIGVVAHLFALYGWMSWQFWNHIAATVLWAIAALCLIAWFKRKGEKKKAEGAHQSSER